jgi:hypothetical protein
MQDVNYIVTGHMRSGTSMMVHALEAGGMGADYDNSQHEYFELPQARQEVFLFPSEHVGHVIKVFWNGLSRLRVGKYRYVFMRRSAEAVRRSYKEKFGTDCPPRMNRLDELMQYALDLLHNRKDTLSVTTLWYEDVLRRPVEEFRKLANIGWPIDIHKAAAIVDPSQCHFPSTEHSHG